VLYVPRQGAQRKGDVGMVRADSRAKSFRKSSHGLLALPHARPAGTNRKILARFFSGAFGNSRRVWRVWQKSAPGLRGNGDAGMQGTFPDTGLVFASQNFLNARYGDPGRQWGRQDADAWHGSPQCMLTSHGKLPASGKPVQSMMASRPVPPTPPTLCRSVGTSMAPGAAGAPRCP
jgi:hypothetical protein